MDNTQASDASNAKRIAFTVRIRSDVDNIYVTNNK